MKRVMRAAIFAVLAVWLAAPALLLAGSEEFTDSFMTEQCSFKTRGQNPYFILVPGYRLVYEGEEGKEFVRLEITVLDETETVAGVKTRVVEEVEYHDHELVEVSRNFFALCDPTNSVFYFGEDVDNYENEVVVNHDGSWRAGVDGARPGIMMPGTVLLGARYFQEVAPEVALDRAKVLSLSEVVETPAQTFEDVLLTEETTPLEPNAKEYKFYAPGVGLIQDGTLKLVEHSRFLL